MNKKGNTRAIEKATALSLMEFPFINSGRVVTKHFMNLHFFLDQNLLRMLSFLIYRSGNNNSIAYNTKLLNQFNQAQQLAVKKYGGKKQGCEPIARKLFKTLIEKGLVLPTEKPKTFLINPCLTYSKRYINHKFYKEWVDRYNELAKSNKLQNLTQETQNFIDTIS